MSATEVPPRKKAAGAGCWDRMVQQAIAQVLTPIYEPQFSETSYGFRPNRRAHDALRKCQEYANDGYRYVVDMDL